MKINLAIFKKISWKLTIIYSLIFSLILIFLNAAILYGVRFYLVSQSIGQAESSSIITSEKIVGTPIEQTDISDPELLSEAQSDSEINIKIADPAGKIVNETNNFDTSGLNIVSYPDITRVVETGETHLVVKNSKILFNGKTIAYLQVVRNMEKEFAFIKLLFILMAIADLLGIIISLFSGYAISRRILKPIDKITRTAKSISISDLNNRIDVGEADDELTRLAITFNEMIERLQVSFEKQNQFVSDASHELRTPISVIQGYAHLIDRWGKDDKDVLLESIQAIKNETDGMTGLIEELLFLARGDNSAMKLQKEKFSLEELIEEVIKESRLIAPNHHLNFSANGQAPLNADRKMIKQLLRALIDNSIKFTPQSGEISIYADTKPEGKRIVVKDTGTGIPQNEIGNIFNRFYRVDKARTKETGGSGLGLSIAKWIVDAHNGRISVESNLGKGTSITIELP